MELQGINRYPVLNVPGRDPRLKMTPAQFVRAQPQDVQPHYVAMGYNGTNLQAPLQNDGQKIGPLYYSPPHMQRQPTLDFAAMNRQVGQVGPQIYHNSPNPYLIPQQHPTQIPPNYSPEGYYFANPGYYVQHATHNTSNEYFNEAVHPMTLAQQPEDQAPPARYTELENEVEKHKCVSHLFKGLLILSGLSVICLTIAVLFAMTRASPCALIGRRDTRFCSDAVRFLERSKNVLYLLLVTFGIANVFYKFALQAYVQRRAKAMNAIFYIFAFLFAMSIISFNPISLLFYGYLARTCNKLRKIFAEMDAIKAQEAEPKTSQTTSY